MKPPAPTVLGALAARLMGMAAEAGDDFTAFELNVAALAAMSLAREAELGVAARLAESRELAALLGRVEPEAAPGADPQELSLAALEAHLATLRQRVTDAHEWIETQESAEAQAMNADVYAVLRSVNALRRGG